MKYEDETTWRPTSAQEQLDFGTTPVPDYLGQLMPSPVALWRAFESALADSRDAWVWYRRSVSGLGGHDGDANYTHDQHHGDIDKP
jgi:hypothetical protein